MILSNLFLLLVADTSSPTHTRLVNTQAFVSTGTNMSLVFNPCSNGYTGDGGCDFDKDHGKVSQANELFFS